MNTRERRWLVELSDAVRLSSVKRLMLVPEGAENWRPAPRLMSFADLTQHLIDADEWLFRKLKEHGLQPMQGRPGLVRVGGQDEYLRLIARLNRTGEARSALIESLSSDMWNHEIPDERFGGNVSVWWILLRGNLDHEIHTRGQIALYLTLHNECPSASLTNPVLGGNTP